MRIKPSTKIQTKKQPEGLSVIQHRKQIETTLKELHVLQSQIYELNVPQNPHSSSPVKKQIKQLSYLYENMTKPKQKNKLNVKSKDIEMAMRILNNEWRTDTELSPQISDQKMKTTTGKLSLIPSKDTSYKIPKTVLKDKFTKLTDNQFNMALITDNSEKDQITTKDLYNFINYNESDEFDPIQEAYQMFLNREGKFDINKYNAFNESLNLPKIKSFNTFISAIQQTTGEIYEESDTITLSQFRKIIQMEMDI